MREYVLRYKLVPKESTTPEPPAIVRFFHAANDVYAGQRAEEILKKALIVYLHRLDDLGAEVKLDIKGMGNA